MTRTQGNLVLGVLDQPGVRDRIERCIHSSLFATVRNVACTDQTTREWAFVVVWQRNEEWGTHRVCLSRVDDAELCVWGHYYSGPNAMVDAYKDYTARIAGE